MREFLSVPYDPDEEHLFLNTNKSSCPASLQTISQIFDRIKVLIANSSNALVCDTMNSSVAASSQSIANLKADAQKPFSIILKHIICSGIDGFNSGTNGKIIGFL